MTPTNYQFILATGIAVAIYIFFTSIIRKYLLPKIADSLEPHPEMELWEKSQKISRQISKCRNSKDFAHAEHAIKIFARQNGDEENIWHYVYKLEEILDKAKLKVA